MLAWTNICEIKRSVLDKRGNKAGIDNCKSKIEIMANLDARADAKAFRSALGAFATGVTIVTTRDQEGNDIGLTANSFNSVSLEPPMVLWSLDKNALSLKAFSEAPYFAVHILSEDQQALSDCFARKGEDKFFGLDVKRGPGDIPLLSGCSALFECSTAFQYEGGDHEIFVGKVENFENFDRPPLAFLGGKYAMAFQKTQSAPESEVEDSSFSRNSLYYLISYIHYSFDQKMRDIMAEHGMNKAQFYTLSLLGNSTPLTMDVIRNNVVDFAGLDLSESDIAQLESRGFVSFAASDTSLALTDSGRRLMVETTAILKAMDEDAQADIGYNEVQILHLLLHKIHRNFRK